MDHFQYIDGEYHAEDVPVARIAEEIGTPFYCYSTATLTRHYQVFYESLASLKPLVCYAVKANGNVAVIKTLATLGAGADVVSQGEIMLALAASVPPQRIVFSGVGKTREEMAYALTQNILQFNVESAAELQQLNEVAISMGKQARVAFRVNPDVTPGTHAKISTGQKESKFGVSLEEARALYQQAQSMPGILARGVSVHIGSQLTSLEPFALAFRRVREFVAELRGLGLTVDTVDLGGGLGVPYGVESPPIPLEYAEIVKREMAGINAQLIFEPGRLLVANAGILVTRVIYTKQNGEKHFIIVDAGMNDLIRPTLYEAYHHIIPSTERSSVPVTADIVGPVCETGDIFAESRTMPQQQSGNLLIIRTAGAYGAAMSGTYNARPLIPEVMVKGSEFQLIRRRQSYAELITQSVIPSWL